MRRLLAVLGVGLFLFGCSRDKETRFVDVPQYEGMKNVKDAPIAIAKAAKAVVKLQTVNGNGTGSFISPDGLLLTNDHVLGSANCPREGCYVKLFFNYQLGERPAAPLAVFAEVKALSLDLDAAIYQIWTDSRRTRKMVVDHWLRIEPRTPNDLQGQPLYVVGHPSGSIKKWTEGTVFKSQGQWIYTTHISSPGFSGSPELDGQGRIVALLHRSNGNGVITRKGVRTQSVGTVGYALYGLASRLGNPAAVQEVPAVGHPVSRAVAVSRHLMYLSAHQGEALLDDGKKVHLLELLQEACETGLNQTRFSSVDDIRASIAPCSAAFRWFPTEGDPKSDGHLKELSEKDRQKWRDLYRRGAERVEANSLDNIYLWMSYGPAVTEPAAAKNARAMAFLGDYLKRVNPPLTFELVNYLYYYGGRNAGGRDLVTYTKSYRNVANYDYDFGHIVNLVSLFHARRDLTDAEFAELVGKMFLDEKLDLFTKLELESIAYQRGLLKI